jgi:esterase/lipase superfamily enzyme
VSVGAIRSGALSLALLAMTACAGNQGALLPVSAAPSGASTVDMLVATTREPSDEPGVLFNGERASAVSFRDLVVSVPPERAVGSVQWPTPGAADPMRDFAVVSESAIAPQGVAAEVARLTPKSGRALVFVHGYNTRFEAAVFQFAQLEHDMGAPVAPILFSWPSRGRLLQYVYDRESANFSRTDLADLLRAVARNPRVKDVVVLAHSMGAWLATESLRQIALEDGRVPKKISNVILASPDLDVDVFRRQVREMGPDRPLITVFVSREDHALRLSALLAGGIDRVGAVDLTEPKIVAELEATRGVVVLDLSALNTSDPLNHSKFATSPEVVQLLGDSLSAGRPFNRSGAVFANAADAIGGAVGGVAVSPIVLFANRPGE